MLNPRVAAGLTRFVVRSVDPEDRIPVGNRHESGKGARQSTGKCGRAPGAMAR